MNALKSKKRKISILLTGILTVILLTPLDVFAYEDTNTLLQNLENMKTVEVYDEITDLQELEELALNQKRKVIPSNIQIKKEGSKISIEQLLKKSINESGTILEERSNTVIEEIIVPKNILTPSTRDSINTSGTDNTFSCKANSTVYYNKVTYGGRPCVSLTKATWSFSCNSGVKAQWDSVRLGQSNLLIPSNKPKITNYNSPASSKSGTVYPDPKWVPVYDSHHIYSSIVGVSLVFKLGRSSSSTWEYTYSNNLK